MQISSRSRLFQTGKAYNKKCDQTNRVCLYRPAIDEEHVPAGGVGAAALHGAAAEGLAGRRRRSFLAPVAHVALLP